MTTLLRLALLVAATIGVAGMAPAVHADPTAVRRPVPAFHAIAASGSLDVEVSIGKQASVELTADPDTLDAVITRVDGGVLTLGIERDRERAVHAARRPRLVIVATSLTALTATGSTTVTATGVASDRLELRVHGNGKLVATGTARALNARISGSGELVARDLAAGDGTIAVTGSGHVTARVSGVLDAVATGSGKIDLIGHPARISSVVAVGDRAIRFH